MSGVLTPEQQALKDYARGTSTEEVMVFDPETGKLEKKKSNDRQVAIKLVKDGFFTTLAINCLMNQELNCFAFYDGKICMLEKL